MTTTTILFTGQTDAGKSTIIGHLLYKLGYFEEVSGKIRTHLKTINENKSSAKWSYIMDVLSGGIITDANKNKTTHFIECDVFIQDKEFTIIDTPGHQIYIRQLVAGLFSRPIDWVCVVVSCIPEEFITSWKKGTVREDMLLARATGCTNINVVWNKSDLHHRTDEQQKMVDKYIKKLQFKIVKHTNVSGLTGDNIDSVLDVEPVARVDVKEHEPVSCDIVNMNVCFPDIERLNDKGKVITKGFSCVMHSVDGESEVEIIGICKERKPVRMIRNGDMYVIKVKSDKPILCRSGSRIILRIDGETIAFGKIKML